MQGPPEAGGNLSTLALVISRANGCRGAAVRPPLRALGSRHARCTSWRGSAPSRRSCCVSSLLWRGMGAAPGGVVLAVSWAVVCLGPAREVGLGDLV